ncbi:MAG TPA: bifunctional nuclease domain-containing protein [Bacteroidota bacterium]|nr:bifunctional nuclease domain-containing protein [Bacteroidota bacterium]
MEKIQVDILGLSTSPASGGAYALILKEVNGNRRLPIIIGAFEAQSIALEMEGIKPPRPLTHDLMKNILETMGSDLAEIVISELKDGTFFARLAFDSREIDARPSDAIALAVRFGAPIYVADSVMDEAGFLPDNEQQEEGDAGTAIPTGGKDSKISKLEAMRAALKEAVEREDYEKAAKLRDEIRRIEQSQ